MPGEVVLITTRLLVVPKALTRKGIYREQVKVPLGDYQVVPCLGVFQT